MDAKGEFAAALLDASARGIAAMSLEAALKQTADLAARALLTAHEASADAEVRVRHLAEAAATGVPRLFADHVEWSQATAAARGVPAAFVPATVAGLAEVVERELPQAASTCLKASLEAGRLAATAAPTDRTVAPAAKTTPSSLTELANHYLLALLEGNAATAFELIEKAWRGGAPSAELRRHVLAAALRDIGVMWQHGEAHVAEERLATAIVGDTLARLRALDPPKGGERGRILIACVEGNLHDLGARMVADQLAHDGWTTFFLGANVPTRDLLCAATDHAADLIAISAKSGLQMRATARLVAAAGRRLPVVVGGAIFDRIEGLWRAVGAAGCAESPEEASQWCARLLGR